MSVHRTQLKRVADQQRVDAELHDELPIDVLFDAEELWSPERVRFLRDCMSNGVPRSELPESRHWNWALKAFDAPTLASRGLSASRLFGIKAEDTWQGLLLASSIGHVTRLDPRGRDLVYVEYVEKAPWNWEAAKANRRPKFKGVGSQLVELAVQWSIDLELKGRVGLHSLPQADGFYRDVCRMTDLGPDPDYDPLRYFEFTEEQADDFL